MGRFLLLTGEKGTGKTTAVRWIVEDVGRGNFVGFFANEVRRDDERLGFEITTLSGDKGILASVESESPLRVGRPNSAGIGRYGIDLSFLEDVCVPLIRTTASHPDGKIFVLDEIGPMQLHSEAFKDAVTSLLHASDEALVLGTIVLRSTPWTDEFKDRPGVETFLLTDQNRESLTRMMSLYVRELTGPAGPLGRRPG